MNARRRLCCCNAPCAACSLVHMLTCTKRVHRFAVRLTAKPTSRLASSASTMSHQCRRQSHARASVCVADQGHHSLTSLTLRHRRWPLRCQHIPRHAPSCKGGQAYGGSGISRPSTVRHPCWATQRARGHDHRRSQHRNRRRHAHQHEHAASQGVQFLGWQPTCAPRIV